MFRATSCGARIALPRWLEEAEPWDLIVLDEAHHARRRGAGSAQEKGPNALLGLMRKLKDRTQGLVLLTATPMQVHPVEVWDLLSLLGLPPEWTRPNSSTSSKTSRDRTHHIPPWIVWHGSSGCRATLRQCRDLGCPAPFKAVSPSSQAGAPRLA